MENKPHPSELGVRLLAEGDMTSHLQIGVYCGRLEILENGLHVRPDRPRLCPSSETKDMMPEEVLVRDTQMQIWR